jgi:hypothetical protein
MTLKQTGSQYSGNLLVTGTPTDPSGPTEGIVSGNEVRVMRPTNVTGSLGAGRHHERQRPGSDQRQRHPHPPEIGGGREALRAPGGFTSGAR